MRNLTVTLLGLMLAASAQAATHRTFVSAEGTDSGACAPTTPCRTLSYAQTQTNSGGEIVITQSGGYGDATGGLTITKSISIIAEPGVFAALAPTSGNGVTIATAGVDVVLKGLTINGRGGNYGVLMTAGTSLRMYNCTVSGFTNNQTAGIFIDTTAKVVIENTISSKNYNGIVLDSGAKAEITRVSATNNTYIGIALAGDSAASPSAITTAAVSDSTGSQNGIIGFVVAGRGGTPTGIPNNCVSCTRYLEVTNSRTSNNGGDGLLAIGNPGALLTVANTTATNNTAYGIDNFASTVKSAGNNVLSNNGIAPTLGTITTTGVLY